MLQFNENSFKQATNKIQYIESIKDKDSIDWYTVSKNQKLSEEFIIEFKDKIEFKDRVDWFYISRYQKLSEDFIRKFQDKVWWYWILKNEKIKLSEAFIIEMKLKGVWWTLNQSIKNYQNLFITEIILKGFIKN